MFNQRDRLLAGLFVVQLLAAVCFGGVLIHTLHQHNKSSTVVQSLGSISSSGTQLSGGGSATTTTGGGSSKGGSNSTGSTSTNTTTGSSANTGSSSTTTTGNGSKSKTGNGKSSSTTTASGTPAGAIKPGAPITVGSIVTEEQGINFTASAQATQAYIQRVDQAGGVDGHQIHLLLKNDELSPQTGLSEAHAMIAEGVFAFMGWNAPETENEIVPFLAQNKIPLVGSYGEYAEYHSPWAYAFSASYGHYGYEMGKYLVGLGVKNPGFIYIDNGSDAANNGLVNAFIAGVHAAGGTVNTRNIYKEQPTQATYESVALSLKAAGVDGIGSILDEASYNRLQQGFNTVNYHPIHLADPLWPDSNVTHDSTNDGTYVVTDFRFVNPGVGGAVGDYVSTVKQAFGSSAEINYIGEQGWLDAEIFVDALKKCGKDITRQTLMQALDRMNVPGGYGMVGPLVPTTTTHDISHCVMFGKWNGTSTEPTTNWICDNEPF